MKIVHVTPSLLCLLGAIFSVVWLKVIPPHADAQPANGFPAVELHGRGQCSSLTNGGRVCVDDSIEDFVDFLQNELEDEDDEEDPMLEEMPGFDFKAYKRADISSFYNEAPGSHVEMEPSFQGQAGKFVNMSPHHVNLHWDAGGGPPGNYQAHVPPFGSSGTSTFPGHVFYFIKPDTNDVLCSFRMVKGVPTYYYDPYSPNNSSDASTCVKSAPDEPVTSLPGKQKQKYDTMVQNREFAAIYKDFTGGSEWLGNFPAEPPKHHIWRADYFGQEHHIVTDQTQFREMPPEELLAPVQPPNITGAALPLAKYRDEGLMNITITAVSVAPRIFQIDNFLSEVEVDHLLDLATHRTLKRSTTGTGQEDASVSNVRTSKNTWLRRDSSPIMDAIIRRGADVLKIDEALFRRRTPSENIPGYPDRNAINEELQVVHYDKGQQYTAHHDFGYPTTTEPNFPTRSINLCMYLNEGMVGGETHFPRARSAESTDGVKAVPKKGKAMIFYMRTPDGNLDDLSQHAALPVIEGHKFFANLWIWDPIRG